MVAWTRLGMAAIALLTVTACSTSQTGVPDAGIPLPESWVESDVAPVALDLTTYWQLLDDPLLADFVEAAIANNLDLAQSAARLDQARAQLNTARAGYFPQLSASGSASRDIGDLARDDLQFSLGVDASWEADLFGRIGSDVAASEADLAAAGYSLADLQRLITGQVALATIQARATALQAAIARDTLAYQDENLQIARWRVEAGLVSSLDVEQARGQRAQTAASIPLLESNLTATANAISTLIGEPPGRVLDLLEDSDFVPDPPALAGFEPPAEVLRRRPDVRSAEASLLSSTSTPAALAIIAASASPQPSAIASMLIESVTIRPSKPSSSRRSPVRMRVLNVAGSSSSAGKRMCAVIIAGTPASIAATNGANSVERSSSREASISGRPISRASSSTGSRRPPMPLPRASRCGSGWRAISFREWRDGSGNCTPGRTSTTSSARYTGTSRNTWTWR